MVELPQCRHRGSLIREGWHVCGHPQVMAPEGVDADACRVCATAGMFCDKEPVAQPRTLTRSPERRFWSKPWNLLKSLRDFVGDGCRTLSLEDYQARLMVCTHCDKRDRNTCAICGCYLSLKARGRAFKCPLDKWPKLPDEPESDPGAPPPPESAG